jgi:hypothetical protein
MDRIFFGLPVGRKMGRAMNPYAASGNQWAELLSQHANSTYCDMGILPTYVPTEIVGEFVVDPIS